MVFWPTHLGEPSDRHTTSVNTELSLTLHYRAIYPNRRLTLSVCHAVEEDPVVAVGSVFDEGHVVAGLDAEHSEQLQLVSDQSVRFAAGQVSLGNIQGGGLMGPALRVRVHLRKETHAVSVQMIFFIVYQKKIWYIY